MKSRRLSRRNEKKPTAFGELTGKTIPKTRLEAILDTVHR